MLGKKKPLSEGETEEFDSYEDLYPGEFMRAAQLTAPVTLTVTGFVRRAFPGKGGVGVESKGVLSFGEIDEKYVSQKTNHVLLQAMFGADPKAVIGKRITFFQTTDNLKGKEVPAIRVMGSPDLGSPMSVQVTYKGGKRKPRQFSLINTNPQRLADEIKAAGGQEALEKIGQSIGAATWLTEAEKDVLKSLYRMRAKGLDLGTVNGKGGFKNDY